jgi:hypothetical protein
VRWCSTGRNHYDYDFVGHNHDNCGTSNYEHNRHRSDDHAADASALPGLDVHVDHRGSRDDDDSAVRPDWSDFVDDAPAVHADDNLQHRPDDHCWAMRHHDDDTNGRDDIHGAAHGGDDVHHRRHLAAVSLITRTSSPREDSSSLKRSPWCPLRVTSGRKALRSRRDVAPSHDWLGVTEAAKLLGLPTG